MLEEKKLKYKSTIIDILKGEQYEPSYMKLNPKGAVPTLVHNGKVIPGSLAIIRYVDETFSPGSLTPQDPEAKRAMDEWLQLADQIPLEVIIYGKRIQAGGPSGKQADTLHQSRIELLSKKVEGATGELREFYAQKLKAVREVDEKVHNASLVEKLLVEHLERGAMDRLEAALTANEFLVGKGYTLADAYWTLILGRMGDLGMGARFWALGKRPHVEAYYKKMMQRPSYQSAVAQPIAAHNRAKMPKQSFFGSRLFWVSALLAVGAAGAFVMFNPWKPRSF